MNKFYPGKIINDLKAAKRSDPIYAFYKQKNYRNMFETPQFISFFKLLNIKKL